MLSCRNLSPVVAVDDVFCDCEKYEHHEDTAEQRDHCQEDDDFPA